MGEAEKMNTITVRDYDPAWPAIFDSIAQLIKPHVTNHSISIEHVGSTAVVGLPAKPIIDIDIIIESKTHLPSIIKALNEMGYTHRGDLGIPDREAFSHSLNLPAHNLYVCLQNSIPLRNHLALRDILRADQQAMVQYGNLKKTLAKKYPEDIDAYIEGKTEFILSLLKQKEFSESDLSEIDEVNKQK